MGAFSQFFFRYLIQAKTRQGLLFLAFIGLFLSAFALLALQSIMNGLQHNLKARSKYYGGDAAVELETSANPKTRLRVKQILDEKNIFYSEEYVLEALLKNREKIVPVVVHGIDLSGKRPPFLQSVDMSGLVLGAEIVEKLALSFRDVPRIISPVHSNSFLGDVPRYAAERMSDIVLSEISEIDHLHVWSRLSLVQNLIREKKVNVFRLFKTRQTSDLGLEELSQLEHVRVRTWEQDHQTLVWSLNLERAVMVSLFIGMSLLVAICITSGFFVFFYQMKKDLVSFWVLGMPKADVFRQLLTQGQLLAFLSVAAGVGLSAAGLLLLQQYGEGLMPAVFVERSIPVRMSLQAFVLSFLIPYSIALGFLLYAWCFFRREQGDFLRILRDVNAV